MKKISYGLAILEGFEYLLDNYPETFVIGQGVWSPWYVGNTMKGLDEKYGTHRIIDTPTSESAVTGLAIGASLAGKKGIVVHPRMDFMLYAMDAIVNQAAKWNHMFGGQSSPSVTIRSIINRGGEQGAQHSQALHSWFAHIPGLKVVMPATVQDARDLLISSVLSPDPIIFIDDRWLYEEEETIHPINIENIINIKPQTLNKGDHLTIVASGYSSYISKKACSILKLDNISIDLIDLRVVSPLDTNLIIESVKKTKNLLCVDGGWSACGMASEVITSILEKIDPQLLLSPPQRITLPDSPAPSSIELEKAYYTTEYDIVKKCKLMLKR